MERGVSLVLALLVTSFLLAIGLGLALVVSSHLRLAGRYRTAVSMLAAAEGGLELAAHDLVGLADWDAVLRGDARSGHVDGAPSGVRSIPGGGMIDLAVQSNLLTCGRPAACSASDVSADSRERPWGTNNPWWRPFAYGPMQGLAPFARPGPFYIVVWVADDRRESDGDPARDGGGLDGAGRGVLRVRSEAFGGGGARQAVEAELARVCWSEDGSERCQPGIRVQSWREVRQVLP